MINNEFTFTVPTTPRLNALPPANSSSNVQPYITPNLESIKRNTDNFTEDIENKLLGFKALQSDMEALGFEIASTDSNPFGYVLWTHKDFEPYKVFVTTLYELIIAYSVNPNAAYIKVNAKNHINGSIHPQDQNVSNLFEAIRNQVIDMESGPDVVVGNEINNIRNPQG